MNIHGKNLLTNNKFNVFASMIGLILVIYSIFAFDSKTPWPSFYTLIPTIGTGLIIFFSTENNIVGKILSNKLLVGIGLISYSAYLWHQPIIAFSKNRSLSGLEELSSLTLIITSFTLAYFTWKYLEKPFRNKNITSSRFIFYFSVIGSLIFISAGLLIYKNNGYRTEYGRIPPNIEWFSLSEKLDIIGDICKPRSFNNSGMFYCEFGDINSSRNIVLYGDSHAQALSEELNKYFKENGIKGIKITLNECEVIPALRLYVKNNTDITDKCLDSFSEMLSFIRNQHAEIVISSRWTFKLYPIIGKIDQMPARNSEGGIEKETYREYVSVNNGKISFDEQEKKYAIKNFLDELLNISSRIYLIYPIPEISKDIARINLLHFRENKTVLGTISIPYNDFLIRNNFINSVFDEYNNNAKLIGIKPESVFCNSFLDARCVAQFNSIPFYYDDDHLSDAGAHLIVQELSRKINYEKINR
jgi:hypothetical protein